MWTVGRSVVAACVLASGCVTWVGHELPTVGYEDLAAANPKPAADYEVWRDNGNGSVGLVALEKRDDVRKVLERSGYFSRVHPGAGTEPYHLKFVFSDATGATQRSFQSVNAVFFILSFTMIPMYESGIDALVVDVQCGNRTLRQYRYRESQGGICWTPVGFLALGIYAIAALNDPPPSIEKILLNFLHDLQRDGLMTGQPPG